MAASGFRCGTGVLVYNLSAKSVDSMAKITRHLTTSVAATLALMACVYLDGPHFRCAVATCSSRLP